MATLLTFLQGHGIAVLLAVFTFVSLVLTALGSLLQSMGQAVPGWFGSVVSFLGSVVHFLNGNVAAAAPITTAQAKSS